MSQFKDIFRNLKPESQTQVETPPPVEEPTPVRGRPKDGKRSNPDFTQVTAYIKKATYQETRKHLLDQDQEFSELVQELLERWLAEKDE